MPKYRARQSALIGSQLVSEGSLYDDTFGVPEFFDEVVESTPAPAKPAKGKAAADSED